MKLHFLASTLLTLGICATAEAQVRIEHVDARVGDVSLTGNAQNEDLAYFALTRQVGSEAGAVWLNGQRDLSLGFQLDLDVTLDPPDVPGIPPQSARGADGIVIVFQKQGQNAIGTAGQGMGAYRNNVYGGSGIQNGFGIELDTFENQNDCAAPHIGVQGMYLTGEMSGENAQSLVPCALLPERVVGYHQLRIVYDAGTLTVYLDNIQRLHQPFAWPLLDANVFVGVTAGSGAIHEAQAHSLYSMDLRRRLRPTTHPLSCEVADWSLNGEVSVHDIFSFLASYFSPGGSLTLGDLFAFLDSFFLCRH